ncbi:MAG: hypothetical protein GC164_05940 [Phycisphaera sp.]|nr:hypothetical protein [Phycisphaera sp.]
MRHASTALLAILVGLTLGLAPSTASAQHAGFVLFGEPNEAGRSLPAERVAVHPVTSPYYHEDSFVTTDLRAWYIYHNFPKGTLGGSANVYALQIRVALTDTLQLVAYKDGYTDFNTAAVPGDGWNDLAAGLKWNFLQDWESDLHAAVGVGYQFGSGEKKVLQSDDELRLWASVNKGFNRLHLGATINLLIPTDGEDPFGDSTRLFWHLHADYFVCQWFSPVIEFNGYHTIDDGKNKPLPFSGLDVASLGGGQGQDVITIGFGGEIRPCEHFSLRAAFETPLLKNDGLFGHRVTVSAVVPF